MNNSARTWPEYFHSDFTAATVRLTSMMGAAGQYLLFGCVELFPHEIPTPPSGIKPRTKQIGDFTFVSGIATASTAPCSIPPATRTRAVIVHDGSPADGFLGCVAALSNDCALNAANSLTSWQAPHGKPVPGPRCRMPLPPQSLH